MFQSTIYCLPQQKKRHELIQLNILLPFIKYNSKNYANERIICKHVENVTSNSRQKKTILN